MNELVKLEIEWSKLKNEQENTLRHAKNEDRLAEFSESEYERKMAKKFSIHFYEEAEKQRLELMEIDSKINQLKEQEKQM